MKSIAVVFIWVYKKRILDSISNQEISFLFVVSANEVADALNQEQLGIVVRYIEN